MKKSILFILHLPPPVHGAAMVGKYLKESKHISNAFDADFLNLTTANSLDSIGKPGLKKIFALLQLSFKVSRALTKKKYDLCYVTLNAKGTGYYKDLIIVCILKLFQKKIVYHFHNKGIAVSRQRKLNDLLYRFTFNGTKSILLSQRLYPDIANYVREKDTFFCANGIPELNGISLNRANTFPNDSPCQLLFLSNMIAEKGIHDLLKACKILKNKGILFACHFVGAWAEMSEDQTRLLVKNEGLCDVVFFHGKKIGAEKEHYFSCADVFVFPTYYHNECFPLVNLEAMQHALPVVSTAIGGIPDMVKDNETGFLVPPQNPSALAEKLEHLILNRQMCKKMGLAGRKLYESNFTLEKFEINIKSILEKAILE